MDIWMAGKIESDATTQRSRAKYIGRSYRLEVLLKGRGQKIRGYGKVAKRRPFSEVIVRKKKKKKKKRIKIIQNQRPYSPNGERYYKGGRESLRRKLQRWQYYRSIWKKSVARARIAGRSWRRKRSTCYTDIIRGGRLMQRIDIRYYSG